MTDTLISILLMLHPIPSSQDGPFRGSQESVAPRQQEPFRGSQESVPLPRRNTSGGMTLEALHGLPRTRPVYYPPQPQYQTYQPYIVVYPGSASGMGGYVPPGARGGYRPGLFWWGRY